jgi:hypothetical protein
MKNVTISVDEAVARWARVAAAKRDVSISRFIAELLQERMPEEATYEVAMKRSIGRRARRLKEPGSRYPTREELHD